jgi:hypothetical protein
VEIKKQEQLDAASLADKGCLVDMEISEANSVGKLKKLSDDLIDERSGRVPRALFDALNSEQSGYRIVSVLFVIVGI